MTQKLAPLGHIQRKNYLEENYGTRTQHEIALSCHVSRSTIVRDIAKWKASGDYDEWLDQRWHELLEHEDISHTEKFRALTRLKERRMTKKLAQTTQVQGTIEFIWRKHDDPANHDKDLQ